MSFWECMRLCNNAFVEYERHESEETLKRLSLTLDAVCAIDNLDVFDPSSSVVTNFYLHFYKFLEHIDSNSILLHRSLCLLEKIGQNKQAKSELINKYIILPVLTKIFIENTASDVNVQILQLLASFTYGIKIQWKESHLHTLISKSVEIITHCQQDERVYGLEILVNLCYKNLPALYIFSRKVDVNKFMISIAKMNSNALEQLLVCKMMIIFQQIKGHLPESDFLNIIDLTFLTLREAYQSNDCKLLKASVDFFCDISENEHFIHVAPKYQKYIENTRQIIDLIDVDNVDSKFFKCVSSILDFLSHFISANLKNTTKYLPRLLDCCVKYLHNAETSFSALTLLDAIIGLLSSAFSIEEICIIQKLTLALTVAVNIAHNFEPYVLISHSKRKVFILLLKVLTAMLCMNDLKDQVVLHIKVELINSVAKTILGEETDDCNPICGTDVSELSVGLLTLVSKMAHEPDWKKLLLDLLNRKRMLYIIAKSFYDGTKEVKYNILEFWNSSVLDKHTMESISEIMCEIKPSSSFQSLKTNDTFATSGTLTAWQESQLDELLDGLHAERNAGRLAGTSTGTVMELYDYKLIAMRSDIESADKACITLNHQVAQLRAEASQLSQLHLNSQQCIDRLLTEKNDLIIKLKTIGEQGIIEKNQFTGKIKELKKQIVHLEKIISSRDAELTTLNQLKDEVSNECSSLKESLAALNEKYDELKANKSQTDGLLRISEDKIVELEENVLEKERKLIQCKADSTEKENEIKGYQKRLEELETMQKIIYNVVAKKDNYNESH